MKKLLVIFLCLLPVSVWASEIVPGTAVAGQFSSGVNAENLSATPVTDTIPIGKNGGRVTLQLIITAGTTTTVTASCEESQDGSNWTWIETTDSSGTASKAVITYTVTSVASRGLYIDTDSKYIRCTLDDAADGTGTVVVRGNTNPY